MAIRLLESRVAADDEGGERLRCGLGFGGERAGGFVDCGKIRSGPLRPVDDELSGRPRGTAAYGSRGKRGALAGREPERLREQRDALPPVAPFERADPVDAHPSTFGERFLGEARSKATAAKQCAELRRAGKLLVVHGRRFRLRSRVLPRPAA